MENSAMQDESVNEDTDNRSFDQGGTNARSRWAGLKNNPAVFQNGDSKKPANKRLMQLRQAIKGVNKASKNIDTSESPEEYNLKLPDGRRIDYVLCYENKPGEDDTEAKEARRIFQDNLKHEKLELAFDKPEHGNHHFVLIHAPWDVLSRYADIMKSRMPMRELPEAEQQVLQMKTCWDKCVDVAKVFTAPFQLNPDIVPYLQRRFTCVYSKDKEYLFDIPKRENRDLFFSNTQRSRIVDYILRRTTFDPKHSSHFGIRRMINEGYYTNAFPLHEGGYGKENKPNTRKLLYNNWASWKCFYKEQPLDYIRNYYGEKVGLYFAWLGFYTMMLFPAAVVGLIVFIYGVATLYANPVADEICHPKEDIIMCPLCDLRCDFWNITDACAHARVSHLFDNGATFFFAILMTIWGTLFLRLWRRKESEIQFRWGLSNFEVEEEPARPEFLAQLDEKKCRTKKHRITGVEEPHYPFLRHRLPVLFCSFSVMILLALLALVFVVGVIAYRMCILMVLYATDDEIIYRNATMVTSATAAIINLLVIFLLNFVYTKLADVMTNWENLRTQSEYDDSLTLKLNLLQFVNYYSSLFYIAFFKGRFTGQPNEYTRLFGARQEECMPGGCLMELCIQLFIIMVGKQFAMGAMEIVLPKLMAWFNKYLWNKEMQEDEAQEPWEHDISLNDPGPREIFNEYLEMLLQFGFITIFVAAFPLAPLFALLNNIIEIRGDAQKFVCSFRRPVAQRKEDIGIWYDCLFAVSRIAIVSNALIIAFTSDFVPRLVYTNAYSPDGTLHGYINNSLSYFQVEDFENGTTPAESMYNFTAKGCRYKTYTYPPGSVDEYKYTQQHWHVLAARVLFVAAFENFCVVLTSLLAWMIPGTPIKLTMIMRRENYITNEIILKTELERAHGNIATPDRRRNDRETSRFDGDNRLKRDDEIDTRLSDRDLEKIVERADDLNYAQPPSRTSSRPQSVHSETRV